MNVPVFLYMYILFVIYAYLCSANLSICGSVSAHAHVCIYMCKKNILLIERFLSVHWSFFYSSVHLCCQSGMTGAHGAALLE